MWLVLLACTAFGQGATKTFFEGTLDYKVEIEGQAKEALMENQPNNLMMMHLKDGNYIVNLAGGMYPKTFMYVADSNFEYSMDMKNKRAFKVSAYNHYKPMWTRPAAQATGKTEAIKVKVGKVEESVMCEVFEVKTDTSYTKIWASDRFVANTALYEGKTRAQANFLLPGLDGKIPLKSIKKEKDITQTIYITKITPQQFKREQFTIPKDFEIQRRDRRW